MKTRFCVVLLALASALASGCKCGASTSKGGGSASGTGSGGKPLAAKRLVVHLEVEPATLNYMLKPDAWTYRMTAHSVFEALVRIDPRSKAFAPELASRYAVSPDGKRYTFTLRQGVKWHDGAPFGARDVKFTFDRVFDPKVNAASTRAALGQFVDKVTVSDARTVVVTLKQRSFFFLQALASMVILPRHLMSSGDINRHPLLRKPVGTGPYRFVSWKSGQRIRFARFDGYWGNKPAIANIEWRIVRSADVALKLASRGELDFLPRLQPNLIARAKGDAQLTRRFRTVRHTTPGTAYALFNCSRPLLADARVRRALAQLLDMKTIIAKLMHGSVERVPSLFWKGDPNFDAKVPPPKYDPKAARELLAEAGWRDRDGDGLLEPPPKPGAGKPAAVKLTFLLPASSKTTRRWLAVYREALRKAGVALEITPLEWATFLSRVREGAYDMAALGMQLAGPHTDLYLQLHSSQAKSGQNYGRFNSARVDKLLVDLRRALSPERRKEIAGELQRLLAREMPVIPLFSLSETGLVARHVKGVYASDVWYQLRDWSLE